MKRFTNRWTVIPPILVVVTALASLIGCSAETDPAAPSGDATKSSQTTGFIQLTLIDAPVQFDDFILVLDGISAHRASDDPYDGWYELEFEPAEYHLLDLTNGVSELLTEAALPTGHYNQIRLHLADGNRIVVDGKTYDLRIPAGLRRGLIVQHEFDIVEGETYAATLDFDAAGSVRVDGRGRYCLQPVLRVQANDLAGGIAGSVYPPQADVLISTVSGPCLTSTHADPVTGEFVLPALPAGSYCLCFTPQAAGPYQVVTIVGIDVIAGQTTDVGQVMVYIPVK